MNGEFKMAPTALTMREIFINQVLYFCPFSLDINSINPFLG